MEKLMEGCMEGLREGTTGEYGTTIRGSNITDVDAEGSRKERMQEQPINTNAERSDLEDRCLDLYRSLLLAVPVRCEAQKLSAGELKQKEAIRGGKMLCQWLV